MVELKLIPLAITASLLVVGRVWVKSIENKEKERKRRVKVVVTEVHVFPIKSCSGIAAQSWKVGKYGFENDRKWMIVFNESKRLCTQRQHPTMSLIRTSFNGTDLCIDAPQKSTLIIKTGDDRKQNPIIDVGIWKDNCSAVDEGDEAAKWFSDYLGVNVRLVRIPDDHHRVIPKEKKENYVSFVDAYPFLLTSEESLIDLNKRANKNLPMLRFRPNIVVKAKEGGFPFMEDTWKRIKIGNVIYRVSLMCTRCRETTVDFNKGEFDGEEPLKTLATFRKGLLKGKKEVCFGQNLTHENVGECSVGQTIEILQLVD